MKNLTFIPAIVLSVMVAGSANAQAVTDPVVQYLVGQEGTVCLLDASGTQVGSCAFAGLNVCGVAVDKNYLYALSLSTKKLAVFNKQNLKQVADVAVPLPNIPETSQCVLASNGTLVLINTPESNGFLEINYATGKEIKYIHAESAYYDTIFDGASSASVDDAGRFFITLPNAATPGTAEFSATVVFSSGGTVTSATEYNPGLYYVGNLTNQN